MTDKEKTVNELKEALDSLDITNKYRLNIIRAIEYLQKEPASGELEEAAEEWDESLYRSDAFKAGAKWQKEKDLILPMDLGEYINELSKQFPEVSFAKLSRIAVRVAKWQKEQMMAKAIDAKLLEGHLIRQKGVTHPLHVGDKVKVIIIKED